MSSLRDECVRRLAGETFDVLVIGGGINGAVTAACLSARGAKVALIDRGDFASATSQESSNLAWGGIKYLENYELGLVRELCVSRNHLIRSYPSTVQEIRFFAVHPRGFRHGLWKLVLGTFLYWLFGSFFTARPRWLSRADIAREEPLIALDGCDGGFEYSDAYLHDNDARFVFGFVRSALDHGCAAANYVEALEPQRQGDGWVTRCRDVVSGRELVVRSTLLVNACGPWVDAANERAGQRTKHKHALSKGIHLLVDRITPHRRVLTFFADDGRLFFVIPMGPRTVVGTTDTPVDAPEVSVTDEDRRFVLDNINKRLALPKPLTREDVIAERCGVRPLAVERSATGEAPSPRGLAKPPNPNDWLALSRKHEIEVDHRRGHISIFGGKLTDCLNVGEEMAHLIGGELGHELPYPDARWYGEPPAEVRDQFLHQARLMRLDERTAATSSEPLSARLWRRYGREAFGMLEAIRADPSMADVLIENAEYIRVEIEQAARREMIVKLSDFLRRRSKIELVVRQRDLLDAPGLREACRIFFGDAAEERLAEYFQAKAGHPASRETTQPGEAAALVDSGS